MAGYRLFEYLLSKGYQIQFHSHAEAILANDFADASLELERALEGFTLSVEDLITSGGGLAIHTRRLGKRLKDEGWRKHRFHVRKWVDDVEKELSTHEIDHVKKYGDHALALEIEWNNKDTFFDRDLENFKRLHVDAAISVGFVLTRGESLQASFVRLITEYAVSQDLDSHEALTAHGIERTKRQKKIMEALLKTGKPFAQSFAIGFASDKFGEATTHWRKLQERVSRGAGGSCPLVLIGIPQEVVQA